MTDRQHDPTRQLADDLTERIRAFHAELLQEFGLKALRFRTGYGGGSGLERSKRIADGVLKVKVKARNLDLEFERDERELTP